MSNAYGISQNTIIANSMENKCWRYIAGAASIELNLFRMRSDRGTDISLGVASDIILYLEAQRTFTVSTFPPHRPFYRLRNTIQVGMGLSSTLR